MKLGRLYFLFMFFIGTTISSYAQKEIEEVVVDKENIVKTSSEYKPLAPARAAFYSAIVPGLGQAYNKKYWKVPIVYAALGTTIYLYADNSKSYRRYREAYKLRIAGKKDEFTDANGNELLSLATLEQGQKTFKKNRDLALLGTIGIYLIQVVEASINAHLLQFDTSRNLSIKPSLQFDQNNYSPVVGASFNLKF
ncbi:DUF5683 domain-containing protein [Aureivirga sp. CE67]|uniref:DUF5683 domain-containing protein n=1 Tax=Aureivirga sp. CE67 TaxID=1788983 RepID=UPI00293D3C1F|nr:DUF5683 domain-containing protein [Aureivirga sp. CE67]